MFTGSLDDPSGVIFSLHALALTPIISGGITSAYPVLAYL